MVQDDLHHREIRYLKHSWEKKKIHHVSDKHPVKHHKDGVIKEEMRFKIHHNGFRYEGHQITLDGDSIIGNDKLLRRNTV